MPNLVNMEKAFLKNNHEINESMIQKFIYNNTSALGLGELSQIQREKIQPSGGRLDLLLEDENNTRYEIEIQLGATDPSHIIRTIEYWDTERKRYPQFDHCAVIVAEEITGRFMNVISLFNGAIPLIAIQMSAWKNGDDISLTFTKVLDRISLGDDDENIEVTDRNYWESKSTIKMLKNVDMIFKDFREILMEYELKYNKFYIGLEKDGIGKYRNIIRFKPKKAFLWLMIKGEVDDEVYHDLENTGLECSYDVKRKEYSIKLKDIDDYRDNEKLIKNMVKNATEFYNVV